MPRAADEDRLDLQDHLRMAQARGEVAGLRLGSWPFVKRRLIIDLVFDDDTRDEAEPNFSGTLGPDLVHWFGPGVGARVAIELDHGIAAVNTAQLASWARSGAEIIAVARANTVAQPRNRLSTTIIEGADQGSVISVITGGPGTAGIVVDLDRAMATDPRNSVPNPDPLVLVASRNVVLVGQLLITAGDPDASSPRYAALGRRLHALGQLGEGRPVSSPIRPTRRRPPILRFREPGRLSIFEAEDP